MKRMLVNANDSEEVRISIVEDGRLQELHVELADRESYLGNIYKGKVVNIEPSIGAAFVNFGGNKNGFLHASDVVPAFGDPDVNLMDILEGKIRSGLEDGPESMRQVIEDSDSGEDDTASQDEPPASEQEEDSANVELSAEPEAEGEPDADTESDAAPQAEAEPDDELEDQLEEDSEAEAEAEAEDEDGSASMAAAPAEKQSAEQQSAETSGNETSGNETSGNETSGNETPGVAKPGDGKEAVGRKRRRRRPRSGTADREENEKAPEARNEEPADLGEKETGRGARRSRAPAEKRSSSRDTARPPRRGRSRMDISQLLKKGQEVVVQITKEGIGNKGPTLTTYLSLPGRCLVLMPTLPKCGVSRKIDDDRERRRLKRIVRDLDETGSGGIGFIVRTAGVNKTAADLERDLEYLKKLWDVVVKRTKATRPPAPLYVESDLVLRTMRDHFTSDLDEVVVDSESVYIRVRDFIDKLMPRFKDRLKHHKGYAPLFHAYGIEQEVESLFQPRIELPGGGSIVIEQTEALIAIDVNSGKFKPGTTLEDTAYRTNLDAIDEIVRHLRLRDLGGVIIVDFIDMMEEKHRRSVERKFREALKPDRARINIGKISIFGMLEMTRQRVGPGLKRTVFQGCPQCKGTALVRTVQSKALAVLREVRALSQLPGFHRLEAYVNADVDAFLQNRKRRSLLDIEEHAQREIQIRSEQSYPVDVVHYRFLDRKGSEAKVHIPPGLGVHV